MQLVSTRAAERLSGTRAKLGRTYRGQLSINIVDEQSAELRKMLRLWRRGLSRLAWGSSDRS